MLAAYGLVVAGYIVSRFSLSLLYRPAKDAGLEPRVAIVIPGFNEEEAIANSLGAYRIGVDLYNPALKLIPWSEFIKTSGIGRMMKRKMVENSIVLGAKPIDWFASFEGPNFVLPKYGLSTRLIEA